MAHKNELKWVLVGMKNIDNVPTYIYIMNHYYNKYTSIYLELTESSLWNKTVSNRLDITI